MQLTSSAGVKQNGTVEKYPMQVFGKEEGSWVIFLLGCEDFFFASTEMYDEIMVW